MNGDEYEGDFEYGIRKGKGIYKKKMSRHWNDNETITTST
ncbi:MAG: hypothetical protein IJ925_04285 [Muribaculaceae bacterium]|nr:hypothetical protein [Muribaculaceae bacterium]